MKYQPSVSGISSCQRSGTMQNAYTPVTPYTNLTRGQEWSNLLKTSTCLYLRLGFALKLTALVVGFISYYSRGGGGLFRFDVNTAPEVLRRDHAYQKITITLQMFSMIATMMLATFQSHLNDSSKFSRGFRAGSRLLSTAVMLDTVSIALSLMASLHCFNFEESRWYQKYLETSTDWCLFHTSGFLHAICLICYGMAIFYMEFYHDKGFDRSLAQGAMTLYLVAGLLEFFVSFTGVGSFSIIIEVLAIIVALLWALGFEQVTQDAAETFHSRDINQSLGL